MQFFKKRTYLLMLFSAFTILSTRAQSGSWSDYQEEVTPIADNTYNVSTAGQLAYVIFHSHANATINVTADLDFGGHYWIPRSYSLYNTNNYEYAAEKRRTIIIKGADGTSRAMRNLHLAQNEQGVVGLFTHLKSIKMEDLHLSLESVASIDTTYCGLLCGTTDDASTLRNLTVDINCDISVRGNYFSGLLYHCSTMENVVVDYHEHTIDLNSHTEFSAMVYRATNTVLYTNVSLQNLHVVNGGNRIAGVTCFISSHQEVTYDRCRMENVSIESTGTTGGFFCYTWQGQGDFWMTFKGCQTKNINISGDTAGGFIGTTAFMKNKLVKTVQDDDGNPNILENVTIHATNSNAGAIIGSFFNYTSNGDGSTDGEFRDIQIKGKLSVTSDKEHAGGLVAYVRNAFAKPGTNEPYTVSFYNITTDEDAQIEVTAYNGTAGGIMGHAEWGGTYENIHLVTPTGRIKVSGKNYTGGVIGYINSSSVTLNDCTVEYADINGSDGTNSTGYVGGLIGRGYQSTVTNCHVSNSTATGQSYVGGLIGNNTNGMSIRSCYTDMPISGSTYLGGLVGSSASGNVVIEDTYVNADVIGIGQFEGGFVSYITGTSSTHTISIRNCGMRGSVVRGVNSVGGLIGACSLPTTIVNTQVNAAVRGTLTVGGLVGGTAGNLYLENAYTTADVTATGQYVGGLVGQCGGATSNTVTIKNTCSLKDITVSNEGSAPYVGGLIGYCIPKPVIEEGTYVENITVASASSGPPAYAGGFFGNVANSIELKNVSVRGNSSVTGRSMYVGGLFGAVGGICRLEGITIGDSEHVVSVKGGNYTGGVLGSCSTYLVGDNISLYTAVSGGQHVGGVVGECRADTLTRITVHPEASVEGNSSNIGGLVGMASTSVLSIDNRVCAAITSSNQNVGGIVGNCAAVTVSSSRYEGNTISGGQYVGGLIGYSTGKVAIKEQSCVRDATITASNGHVGGLVGIHFGNATISDAYVGDESGAVAVNANGKNYCGGLIGYSNTSATIERSHVTHADILSSNAGQVGGFIGYANTTVTITDSYIGE